MSDYLIDSFGWIEVLTDGPKASEFKKIILSDARLIVSSIVLVEIAAKFHSLGRNEEARQAIGSIKQRAQVIEVSDWIADTAGRIWAENRSKKMGLVDCIILATAMQEKAVVLTGDAHFKEFKNAKVV